MIPSAALPPLYARWIDELLAGPIPAETNATCETCAMIVDEHPADGAKPGVGFNPETKCCTFLPELWNFLVGGVLLDDHDDAARGRATVEARIDRGVAVTPLGLGRSTTFELLYSTGTAELFGQSQRLRCPHYLHEQGGLCGVWRHRESTCATWFCKYVRGAVGQEFWVQLHQLLQAAEAAVAAWALLELRLEAGALARIYRARQPRRSRKLTSHDLDDAPDPVALREAWGSWLGREREFYVECARRVTPLGWADVRRIGGAPIAIHEHMVRAAYSRLMDASVPERPTTALVLITPRPRDRAQLSSYSGSDSLDVPAVVAKILPLFDGRDTAEVLADVRRREGVTIDPSLVRKLTDFGILRE